MNRWPMLLNKTYVKVGHMSLCIKREVEAVRESHGADDLSIKQFAQRRSAFLSAERDR